MNDRTYSYKLGTDIHPEFPATQFPVPPEWVQERAKVPTLAKDACLAIEAAPLFPAQVREILVSYVKDYGTRVTKHGSHLVIAGRTTHRRRNWAAAAVMNEITMRYDGVLPVATEWVGVERMNWMLDQKQKKEEGYYNLRNHLSKVPLLFIEDPLRIENNRDLRTIVEMLYSLRADHKLPTITTLKTDVREDWSVVEDNCGSYIADTLESSHHGYLAHYTPR